MYRQYKHFYFLGGFQGAPQLRYSADYEVIKEQNIAEKISFLNKNLPQSSCVKVRDAPWPLMTEQVSATKSKTHIKKLHSLSKNQGSRMSCKDPTFTQSALLLKCDPVHCPPGVMNHCYRGHTLTAPETRDNAQTIYPGV